MTSIVYYGLPAGSVVRFMDKDSSGDRGQELPLRDDLAHHAAAFGWGNEILPATTLSVARESKALVAGAAQLALAICAHALADDDRALRLHQRFKLRVVSTWKRDMAWAITAEEVAATCDTIEGDELTPQQKAAIDSERPVIEREGGRGVEGPIVWDTDETGQRVRPRGAE